MNKIILTAAVAAFSFSGAALAATVTGNANVNIIPALSITETTEIDFGNIAAVDGTCTMDATGVLTGSGPNAADLNCTGSQTPATFTISGEDGEVVDVSVTAGAAVGGVTFNPVIDGSTSPTLALGVAAVTVRGSIDLASATVGDKNIAYTFTANYQ